MKQRLFHGSGVVLLVILITLVVWQGSFTFGEYAPTSPEQTYLFWAVSTLIFLLMVTLGFMLFRTGLKLYIDRTANREGSRIRTKLVVAALALSFMPVFFLVLFSVSVLNRNLEKWFSRPAQNVRLNLAQISAAFEEEARLRAHAQADWLATLPQTFTYVETGVRGDSFDRLCKEKHLGEAWIEASGGTLLPVCPDPAPALEGEVRFFLFRVPVSEADGTPATLVLKTRMPLDLARKQAEIEDHIREYDKLAAARKSTRATYLLLLALITLFILFVATWIALVLARQISVPISALLDAASRIRGGYLGHRVQVQAGDELASLVRAFNEMTQALEENRREIESRRRFTEAILESIPTGVISVSSDGRIQTVNRALRRIFPERRVEEANNLNDLFSREDAREIRYLMNRARRTGLASRQLDLQTDRQALHLAVTVAALEDRVSSGFVLVLEDTSELLRAQKAAAWHEVARRVAHEIKNPLTPISLCSQRIARQIERVSQDAGGPAPEVQRILRECSETIAKEVASVKTLVDEFSQFARFPAARPAPCDLNEVVENALAVFAGRLDGIELHKALSPQLPAVNIDREQFKRVVVNLVDNAAEAMSEALLKRLYVSTQPVGPDFVELTVADTGCGVSAEDKERLFLPYFSTKGRGTGLGLAIVNHILSDHGAQIRVEDNEPCGARFIVEIPAPAPTETDWKPVESHA